MTNLQQLNEKIKQNECYSSNLLLRNRFYVETIRVEGRGAASEGGRQGGLSVASEGVGANVRGGAVQLSQRRSVLRCKSC